MRLLIGFFLFWQTAQALPIEAWQNASVKLTSFPCLTEAPRFEGSGLLFKKDQDVFVLTSEHVLIHDSGSENCHQADGQSLELIRADFFSGLALLKVHDKNPELFERAVDWNELTPAQNLQSLSALGFPAASDQLSSLTNGRASSVTSHRALIAGAEQMIEASGLPVEYGMSGGTLLAVNGGEAEWAGLLSHQILKREGGKPTKPEDLEPGATTGNDLSLAIPAETVQQWILASISPNNGPDWQRSAPAQREGKSAIQYGSLLFTLENRKAGDVWDIGGAVFGGADGSGIGGEAGGNDEDGNEILAVISVRFLDGAGAGEKSQAFSDPKLEQWRQWLLLGKKVLIPFLKTPDAQRLGRIQSLSQFLTLWKRDQYLPVALKSKDPTGKSETDILEERASKVAQITQVLKDHTSTIEKKAWFTMIRDLAVSAQNALVGSKEISDLLTGANQRYWNEFYVEDFDRAVELESALIALKDQLVKMGL